MKHVPALLLVACLGVLLAGCRREAVYTEESFATDSPFKLKVAESVAVACESARRSLLGQGYLIDTVAGEQVKGRKAYRRDDSQNTFIEMNVVCVADRKGSTLYANGVLSTYDLKKSGNSASVGISAVGSISLPFGQSADSLVKIAEETIEDKAFYGRFFAAVGHVLKEMEERPDEDAVASEKTSLPSATKPAPEADIPLEQGPVDVPGIVPEPGPAPSSPSGGGPVIVPEPGAPAAAPAADARTPASGEPANPAAPGPVQGFSVSAPAASPEAHPARPDTVPAPTPAAAAPGPAPSPASAPAQTPASPPSAAPASATPASTAAPPGTPESAATPVPATTPAATPTPGGITPSTTPAPSAPSESAPAPTTQPTAAPPT